MLNIDTRILTLVDADEFYLLCFITNRIGVNRTAWPSNNTLLNETGWHIEKLIRVKKSLEEKGILSVRKQIGKSNHYSIKSDLIGNYVNGKSDIGEPVNVKTNDTVNGKSDIGEPNEKVLTSFKVLTNEELTIERGVHLIFYKLIELFFPEFNPEIKTSGSEKLKKRIFGAADSVLKYYEQKKGGTPEYRSNAYAGPGEYNALHEAVGQIEGYFDFSRLKNISRAQQPETISQTIIQYDWCAELLKWANENKKYDPVYDDALVSHWLLEYFYNTTIAYVDKADPERIIF